MIIHLFYDHLLTTQPITWTDGKTTYAHWFKQKDKNHAVNAFYYNLQTLLRELEADHVKTVYVTCALNPDQRYNTVPYYFANIAANNKTGMDLAAEFHQASVNFNYDSFACQKCFVDECHLNEQGEAEKAKLIAPTVADMIRKGPVKEIVQ